MKRTGAMILSMMMVTVLIVTNLAGAYHTTAHTYAAEEESTGGGDNQEGGTTDSTTDPQGGNETGRTEAGAASSQENSASTLQSGSAAQEGSTASSSGEGDTTPDGDSNTPSATAYTVTFDANGHGTAPDAVTITEGELLQKPVDPSGDGYNFTGWYRDAGATSAWNFDADTVSDDITLYAGWTEVVPATSQENSSSTPQSGSAGGSSSTGNDASSEGSSDNSEEGDNASGTGSTANTGNTPAATAYTVTFDANGHGTAPDAVTVTEGELLQKPADPSVDGYNFTGWYRDAGATSAWNFDADTVSGDITLYAGWTEVVTAEPQEGSTALSSGEGNTTPGGDSNTPSAITYTVTFDANGHGTAPDAVTVTEGETLQKPADPSADGYNFTGWYKDAAATDAWDFAADVVTGDLKLYAGWGEMSSRSTAKGDITTSTGAESNHENDTSVSNEIISEENEATENITTASALSASLQNSGLRAGQKHQLTLRYDGYGILDVGDYFGSQGDTTYIYALPDKGYRFQRWEIVSGDGKIDNPIAQRTTFTFGSTDTVVNAVFTEPVPGETCVVIDHFLFYGYATAEVDPNDPTTYTITAFPVPGAIFKGWSMSSESEGRGSITDTTAVKTTITNCTGYIVIYPGFAFIGHPARTSVSPANSGTAKIQPGDKEEFSMTLSDMVYLQATPNDGYKFKEWKITPGAGTIGNTKLPYTSLTNVTEQISCEAVFEPISASERRVHVGANNYDLGYANASVSSGSPGTNVTLTATSIGIGQFVEWKVKSGNVTINNPTSETTEFSMGSEDVSIEAVFIDGRHNSITFTKEGEGSASYLAENKGAPGELIDVYATAERKWQFSHWEVLAGEIVLANEYDKGTFFIMGNKNVELKAVFVPKDTHCVHITNDGNGEGSPSVPSGEEGETVMLTATPNPGYMFKEWMVISKGGGTLSSTKTNPAEFTIGTGHATLRATFVAEDKNYPYAITYHLGGGTDNANNPATYTIANTPITLAPPTGATGYTFVGWYDNAAFSGNAITAIPGNSTGDKTFYAKWTLDTYNISYQNLKGASNSNPTTYTYNDTSITLQPLTDPTGYTFEGWYDNSSFSGNAITAIPANSTGDKTFYAKWTADTYNISYQNLNGASNSNPATYTIANTPLTLADLTGGPTGYTFGGWYDNASFSGNAITAIPANSTGDKTFYAKWTADTYNISYQNVNGASNSNPATYTIADTPLTLADLTGGPTGYTFDGWYDDATFSGTPITAIPAGSTGNKTFYAKWTAVQDSFKTETNELNSVPPELLNTPFNTVEKIENELLLKLGVDRTTVNGRWISYDVKLKVSTDGGKTWVDADPGNFPAEGLPVILPYPSGTGQYTHRFQVSHMFTTTVNGYQPGQVETPEATNTKSGIRVTLKGLSPVVIMWERVESSGGGTSASTGAAVSPAPVAQIKQNFDSKYYADTYADLKAAFGYDHDALWNHYVMFGKNEKRKVRFVVGINLFPGMIFNYSDRWQMDDVMLRARIPDSAYFDTDAYADLYPDLKAAFGYNHELLYRHYLKYGRFEGRKVFTRNSFNAKAYADRYADLKKAFGYDKAALWRHYQMFGKVERRFAEWMEDEGQKD